MLRGLLSGTTVSLSRFWAVPLCLLLGTLLNVSSCCDKPEFEVTDMRLRAEFSFSVAIEIEFSLDLEISFDGDLAAWGNLGAATAAAFDYDFSGKTAYAQRLQVDIDDDGVAESVDFLVFSDGAPSDYDHGFAAWRGDRYSFDKGYCYVLSWQDDSAVLMSARCGSTEPALACPLESGEADTSECEVCDATGACAACGSSTVADCIDEGSAALEPDEPMGEGGAAGAAGAPGVTSGGSVDAEFDSCVEEVAGLVDFGVDCGLEPELDAVVLCEDNLSDVNTCFLAVEGAALIGWTCEALASDVCDPVYR